MSNNSKGKQLVVEKSVQTRSVPLSELKLSPARYPRMSRHQQAKEMADSVRRFGILNALLARQGPDGLEVLGGAKRLMAAHEAQLETIPVRIVDADDDGARLISLEDNLRRYKLHSREWDAAVAEYDRLYRAVFGSPAPGRPPKTVAQRDSSAKVVAKLTGQNEKTVRKAIRRDTASTKAVKDAHASDQVTASQVDVFVTLPPEQQDLALELVKGRSVAETRRIVEAMRSGTKPDAAGALLSAVQQLTRAVAEAAERPKLGLIPTAALREARAAIDALLAAADEQDAPSI